MGALKLAPAADPSPTLRLDPVEGPDWTLGCWQRNRPLGGFTCNTSIYIYRYIIYINPAKILDTPKCCFRMNGSGWTRRTYQFRDPMGQRITNDQQSVGSRTLPARKGIPPAASGFSATLWRQRGTNTGFVIQDLAMENHRSQRVNHPFIMQFYRATVS